MSAQTQYFIDDTGTLGWGTAPAGWFLDAGGTEPATDAITDGDSATLLNVPNDVAPTITLVNYDSSAITYDLDGTWTINLTITGSLAIKDGDYFAGDASAVNGFTGNIILGDSTGSGVGKLGNNCTIAYLAGGTMGNGATVTGDQSSPFASQNLGGTVGNDATFSADPANNTTLNAGDNLTITLNNSDINSSDTINAGDGLVIHAGNRSISGAINAGANASITGGSANVNGAVSIGDNLTVTFANAGSSYFTPTGTVGNNASITASYIGGAAFGTDGVFAGADQDNAVSNFASPPVRPTFTAGYVNCGGSDPAFTGEASITGGTWTGTGSWNSTGTISDTDSALDLSGLALTLLHSVAINSGGSGITYGTLIIGAAGVSISGTAMGTIGVGFAPSGGTAYVAGGAVAGGSGVSLTGGIVLV